LKLKCLNYNISFLHYILNNMEKNRKELGGGILVSRSMSIYLLENILVKIIFFKSQFINDNFRSNPQCFQTSFEWWIIYQWKKIWKYSVYIMNWWYFNYIYCFRQLSLIKYQILSLKSFIVKKKNSKYFEIHSTMQVIFLILPFKWIIISVKSIRNVFPKSILNNLLIFNISRKKCSI
jgi:hypothetical protein